MITLYHHPLCPHSRFVRLVLGEYGDRASLIEERAGTGGASSCMIAPAGATPVLVEDMPVVPGAEVIAEYLDETRGQGLGDRRLLPARPLARVETRRLTHWFNVKFFEESTIGW